MKDERKGRERERERESEGGIKMEERREVNDKAGNDLKNIKTTQRERKVERWVLKAENLKNIISTFNRMTLFSFFVSE